MQKSMLHILLKKIAGGDASAKSKVVARLAERLIIVPSLSSTSEGRETKVSVITIKEGQRSLIPIFTTLPLLKDWLEKNEIKGEGISINCADICLALGRERWIVVDPGTDYWCELEPEIVKEISAFQIEEDDFYEDNLSKPLNQADSLPPINATVEVPILPKEIAKYSKLNPPSAVKNFPRLRQKSEADIRPTMDLTNFRKRLS